MNERVIVVGAGGISNAWFPPILAENLKVAAVVDINCATAEKQIEKYKLSGTVASNDLDATLRDVRADFLIDLTIPDAHYEVTTKALDAGLHVVGEKPMAATMEQARKMVAASERTGRLFMTSQSRRWDANHATIASAIQNKSVGEPTIVDCDFYLGAHFGGFRDAMPSPLVLDMAIHHFDLARMFIDRDAVSVYCDEFNPQGSWYTGDAACVCIFEMAGGVRFTYRGSWCSEGFATSWNGEWRIAGTNGTIRYTDDKPPRAQGVDRTEPKFTLPTRELTLEPTAVEKTGMAGGLAEMLRFLRTGAEPQTECHDNIRSLAMVHAALQSAREGRRVRIDE